MLVGSMIKGDLVSKEERNEKLGAFVTNKWLIGVLIGIVMSMAGYIFNGIDRGEWFCSGAR